MNYSTIIARVMSFGLLLAAAGPVVAQQSYPSKPIRIIVPFPPGGSTDPMARMVGAKLTERWGGTVVVDNRPGGSTIIGTSIVASAAPDGYTLGWAGASLLSTPHLFPNLPYDVIKDFVGVTTIAKSRIVLVLHPSVLANNLQEVLALAKARPGQLNYGSSGIGTNVHLSGALFNIVTGVNIVHIPYKGSGPLSTDLLGGRVEMSFQVPITVISFINSGKLKPIAITGESRLSALPNVPTFSEAGLPGYGLTGWSALIAPTGTSLKVLNKISKELAAILATPETLDFLSKQGMEPLISTPEQTTALIKEDVARYGKIIEQARIKYEP